MDQAKQFSEARSLVHWTKLTIPVEPKGRELATALDSASSLNQADQWQTENGRRYGPQN